MSNTTLWRVVGAVTLALSVSAVAWAMSVEARVSTALTSIQYVGDRLDRIEQKVDRMLDYYGLRLEDE